MGVAASGDYNTMDFPTFLVTCVARNDLFRNTGVRELPAESPMPAGMGKARRLPARRRLVRLRSTTALLDLFVCKS